MSLIARTSSLNLTSAETLGKSVSIVSVHQGSEWCTEEERLQLIHWASLRAHANLCGLVIREHKTGLATLASCQGYNLMRSTMGWQRPKYVILLLLAPEMTKATWLVNTLTSPDKESHHAVAIKKLGDKLCTWLFERGVQHMLKSLLQ